MRSQVTRHVLRRPPTCSSSTTATTTINATVSRIAGATRQLSCSPHALSRYTQPLSSSPSWPVLCTCPTRARAHGHGRSSRPSQRRTFIGFLNQKAPRHLKQIEAEPGYETLLTFRAAESDNLRPPPTDDLLHAWRLFFAYKAKHARTVNSTQAFCALRVFFHLCTHAPALSSFGIPTTASPTPSSAHHGLSPQDLRLAMECLARPPSEHPEHHLQLSRLLYRETRRIILGIEPMARNLDDLVEKNNKPHLTDFGKDLHLLLVALSRHGAVLEAKDIFLGLLSTSQAQPNTLMTAFRPRHSLTPIVTALAREGREDDLTQLVSAFTKVNKGAYDIRLQSLMVNFYATRDKVAQAKQWFARPLDNGLYPRADTLYDMLQLALRHKEELPWALHVYEGLVAQLESGEMAWSKSCWDVSFQWAFLLLGKGHEHIEHMIDVATDRTRQTPDAQPDIGTINALLKAAIDKDDPYSAERFVALSKKLGFQPNQNTYLLQLDYRIRANDLEGAYSAYQALQTLEASGSLGKEVPILNKLIRVLCASSRPHYDRILEVTDYLEQRHVTLEPETVVSLCTAFLKNDETFEVMDTLSLHTAHYSVGERGMVRKAFVDYCLDPQNSTARVWDAYALLRQFFPEVEREAREAVMDTFFGRRRADMACHVFGHMRSHDSPEIRPAGSTYVRCFEGIAQCQDEESLQMIHNMLKMDTAVQMNTQLYNALMIGYVACDLPDRALDFWKEITTSPEGPSYATLEIVFRLYEVQPYADEAAKELWAKMQKMEIEVTEEVYTAYLATLAAHSHLPEVQLLLDDIEAILGSRPSVNTLTCVYNALPNMEMKDEYEQWVTQVFAPEAQATFLKRRRRRDANGLLNFKVKRPWKA
ncbi:pentatricopeptide repeat domain-containing protein [Xylariaceae sp. FL1019]|nr:pentatricopeptide repeat domain-containing protein [Xylariaceae sp. FL1019]